MISYKSLEGYAKPTLRIALSLVFFHFGANQLINPLEWIGFIPDFVTNIGIDAVTMVVANGILEIVLGLFMITGLFTRLSSLILGIHLSVIVVSLVAVGAGHLAARDFGLALATIVIFLNGPDKFCLDWKFGRKGFFV